MAEDHTHTFPRGSLESARLMFESGVAPKLDVRGAPLDGNLARARFPDPAPKIDLVGDALRVDYHGFWRWFFTGGYPPGTLELNDAIPWSIDVQGGVAKVDLDLRKIILSRFEVSGGAAKVDVRLGAPRGIVPVRVSGGAARVTITHPRGTGARLRVTGGAAKLDFDRQSFGAVGGGLTLTNREWDDGGNGYDIKIGGGAARLAIETEG